MVKQVLETIVKKKLASADIRVNGGRAWDIQVENPRFYGEVVRRGSLGLGESYMDRWIEIPSVDEFICRIMQAPSLDYNKNWFAYLFKLGARIWNKQSKRRASIVGEEHYDLDNDLFQCMLDRRMTYSCAYWKHATNLNEAQEAKLDLICQKLGLQPGMKVLDIGCGWGSFAKYAAEKYGVRVVGITIAQKQLELAREICKGLPIELRFQDYRDINETFDRIVSVGQMEHVGYKNYSEYMHIAHRSLTPDGLFLLHTIGTNISQKVGDPWIDKYIFPNGMIPSVFQIAQASEGLFVMEDWHNFGADYDKTLMAWHHNFNLHWNRLSARYSDRFYRMWNFYLLSCAGTFRSRDLQLWQIVYSKKGVPGGYHSIR